MVSEIMTVKIESNYNDFRLKKMDLKMSGTQCINTFHSQSKSQDLLVAYVVYLKDQLERHPSLVNLDQLRSVIALVTNKGVLRVSEQSIHFPPAYGNSIDLQEHLPGKSSSSSSSLFIIDINAHQQISKEM